MNKFILVGAGPMAVQYANVLNDLKTNYTTIGRGQESAKLFTEKTGQSPIIGGLSKYLSDNPCPIKAIVATSVESLYENSVELLNSGCRELLVEKPAGLDVKQINSLSKLATQNKAKVFVAYNRRFYQSVAKAREIIEQDGGVTSFLFEFTEVGFKIKDLYKAPGVKENWFLANSTHVVDLAFFIGGYPKEMVSFQSGSLSWHTRGAQFTGAGKTAKNVLFSYHANWDGPGRWSLECVTPKNRLIFAPMEKLKVQELGSFEINEIELDSDIDLRYKAGLFLQTDLFIKGEPDSRFCKIQDFKSQLDTYIDIVKY